jgi:hypothetical protein
MARAFDMRPSRLDRALHDGAQIDPLAAYLHAIAIDSCDIEQIVGQPHELQELPLHGREGLQPDRFVVRRNFQELHRVTNGSEGIPQLMGQGRQELVLATVDFLQDIGVFLSLGQVHANADAARDVPGVVVERLNVVLYEHDGAIRTLDFNLVSQRDLVLYRVLHRKLLWRELLAVTADSVRWDATGRRRERHVRSWRHPEQSRKRRVR